MHEACHHLPQNGSPPFPRRSRPNLPAELEQCVASRSNTCNLCGRLIHRHSPSNSFCSGPPLVTNNSITRNTNLEYTHHHSIQSIRPLESNTSVTTHNYFKSIAKNYITFNSLQSTLRFYGTLSSVVCWPLHSPHLTSQLAAFCTTSISYPLPQRVLCLQCTAVMHDDGIFYLGASSPCESASLGCSVHGPALWSERASERGYGSLRACFC